MPDTHTWYSLSLGDGIAAAPLQQEIKQRVEEWRTRASTHGNPAVLIRHDSPTSLHCEVTAYFSPAAAEIARQFHATACVRPPRPGLDLLAGDATSLWELFQPS